MSTSYPNGVPKDGKLYWMAPDPELPDDNPSCHMMRRWNAERGRYEDRIEPGGIEKLTSRHQRTRSAYIRFDGTKLKEGVGYDPIDVT